jgi:hypothetical protein
MGGREEGTKKLILQTQTNKELAAVKSPKATVTIFLQRFKNNTAVSARATTRSKWAKIMNQVCVRLSRKNCLLTAKFVRHYLPKDRTGQELTLASA